MRIGVSQIEITPPVGAELSGFAARTQPSTGLLDRLLARCLYVEDADKKLLWITLDVLGLERAFVQSFRGWAAERLRIAPDHIMLSATHTHSGPATIALQEAGTYDADYVQTLRSRLEELAQAALVELDECDLVAAEGTCDLTQDRRRKPSAHTDRQAGSIAWRRADGSFVAVLMNYPMHAVALGPTNRSISADVPGQVAATLASELPGSPVVLVTNGACGNLNPPCENVPYAQVQAWGRGVAESVLGGLKTARPVRDARLHVLSRLVPLPLDVLTGREIEAYADKALTYTAPLTEWGDKYRRAIEHWRRTMRESARNGVKTESEVELFGARIGPLVFVGVNTEVFSRFTAMLREATAQPVYVVGYANGDRGYLPTREAYDEGGYEVEVAHLFYGGFRFKRGALETLAEAGAELVRSLAGA